MKNRRRYRSFAWDDFERVKVVNWSLCIPEYCENTEYFRDETISRDYGGTELKLLLKEINEAVEQGYDAVFAVTRAADSFGHDAFNPEIYGVDEEDQWLRSKIDRHFEELREKGLQLEDGEIVGTRGMSQERKSVAYLAMNQLEKLYRDIESLVQDINWEEIDNHVIVSDHGFEKLGGDDVEVHGSKAVFSSDFCEYGKMSEFIEGWRGELKKEVLKEHESKEFSGLSKEEMMRRELDKLGYE